MFWIVSKINDEKGTWLEHVEHLLDSQIRVKKDTFRTKISRNNGWLYDMANISYEQYDMANIIWLISEMVVHKGTKMADNFCGVTEQKCQNIIWFK